MKHLFLFFFLFTSVTFAQKINIRGTVQDTTRSPLEGATVLLMNPADSSLVAFGRSQDGGRFELKNLIRKEYLLKITYVGMKPYARKLPIIEDLALLDLGVIPMKPFDKTLAEVQIRGAAPVTIKQDTIEYNADSFRTRPNAVVEELLKKLPGVQVERDGTIKAQGQEVKRITVDGKEFFGKDPKIATQNLLADAIDKVQVVDKKSEQAMFSGIDDGQREKNINLTLKDDRKNGVFGNATVGYGNDNRYKNKLSLNRFTKKQQLSLIGSLNNINQQGFSIMDYLNFSGDMARMMGGGGGRISLQLDDADGPLPFDTGERQSGFMSVGSVGLNFNQQFSKKTELNGSYFFNGVANTVARENQRDNFLPNRNFTTLSNTNQLSSNQNHRLNLTLEHKIDSLNSLRLTANLGANASDYTTSANARTLGAAGLENQSTRSNTGTGSTQTLNLGLLWRHKFLKKGRTFSWNNTFGFNNTGRDGRNRSYLAYFTPVVFRDTIAQSTYQTNEGLNYGSNVSFTEPIGKRKFVELNASVKQAKTDVLREVFDVKNENRPMLNTLLSNNYNNRFTYQRAGFNFRIVQKKYNYSVGLAAQRSDLEGTLTRQKLFINRQFTNLLPNARFHYDFATSNRLDFNYDTNIREPNINDLAPVIDNSDPLNISVGNPDLRPEMNHQLGLNYMSFNAFDNTSFFVSGFLTYTQNKIAFDQRIDQAFVRTTKPINFGNAHNLNTNLSYGFRLRPLKTQVNLSAGLNMGQIQNLVNDTRNITTQRGITGSIRMDYTLKDKLDASFDANWRYNKAQYSAGNVPSQTFLNSTYTADVRYSFTKTFSLSTVLDYYIYAGQAATNQQIPIWGITATKQLLKNNRGELKLLANDLLNRNVIINRNADINYFQQERVSSLARYFLLTFSYKITKVGQQSGPSFEIKQR